MEGCRLTCALALPSPVLAAIRPLSSRHAAVSAVPLRNVGASSLGEGRRKQQQRHSRLKSHRQQQRLRTCACAAESSSSNQYSSEQLPPDVPTTSAFTESGVAIVAEDDGTAEVERARQAQIQAMLDAKAELEARRKLLADISEQKHAATEAQEAAVGAAMAQVEAALEEVLAAEAAVAEARTGLAAAQAFAQKEVEGLAAVAAMKEQEQQQIAAQAAAAAVAEAAGPAEPSTTLPETSSVADGNGAVVGDALTQSADTQQLNGTEQSEGQLLVGEAAVAVAEQRLSNAIQRMQEAQSRKDALESAALSMAEAAQLAKDTASSADTEALAVLDQLAAVEAALDAIRNSPTPLPELPNAVAAMANAAGIYAATAPVEEKTAPADTNGHVVEKFAEPLLDALPRPVEAPVAEAVSSLQSGVDEAVEAADEAVAAITKQALDKDSFSRTGEASLSPQPTYKPPPSPVPPTSSKHFSAAFFSMLEKKAFPKPSTEVLVFAGAALVAFLVAWRSGLNAVVRQQLSTGPPAAALASVARLFQAIPAFLGSILARLPIPQGGHELNDVLWLLATSVVAVPLFQALPGGSPVLGYLAAGALIGPHALSIIKHVHATQELAEFGVVFLLFNIGLELSLERLQSMQKYVFGLGSAQVLSTTAAIAAAALVAGVVSGPGAIIVGGALALSSTAVALQVLQDRKEAQLRHGRAAFSVLLFQDLAVVVLLMLIPLLAPSSDNSGGLGAIARALGVAAIKAAVGIASIIAGGRVVLRPVYRYIAENRNAEIFAATTLLVVLGTSVLTAQAGLSMALGAFLAGLLLAETEFALQVESDIAPYRGLLLGLFFMTVGMSIDLRLFLRKWQTVLASLVALVVGKTMLVGLFGSFFGLSAIAALRCGLLLAPGGEFAFVAFGEAVAKNIMPQELSSILFLVVALSMAMTPWLAAGGAWLASRFEKKDVRALQPVEGEVDDLRNHIIIAGFGRVGQIIAQLLSERLVQFVALDVRTDRVTAGRDLGLPVFFGDAGSDKVLHSVGAARAAAAVITLDTPGANYRSVWALKKNYPNVKTYVRAHDVDHGLILEKAGATAVVPETLEPSLQLAAAVLKEVDLPEDEIAAAINDFRRRHLSELTELSESTGSSLGYGYLRQRTPIPRAADPPSEAETAAAEAMGLVAAMPEAA
eukprot:jgi/Chlat1/5912/Chrsp4S06407